MPLFGGKPRQIKALDQSIMAARIALNLFDSMPPAQQERALATAPTDIRESTERAAAAGHGDAARKVLVEERAKAPTSSVADRWPVFIDHALAAV
jgi:hypothetical protein